MHYPEKHQKSRLFLLFQSDRLGGRFIGVIILILASTVLFTEHWFTDRAKILFDYALPTTILSLSADEWIAVGVTTCAASLLFIINWIAGYILALCAGLCATSKINAIRLISNIIDNVMDFFYVVPVVLTIALVHTLVSTALSRQIDGQYWITIAPLLAAVFILSGYQVFECAYRAIAGIDDRSLHLSNALFRRPASALPVLKPVSLIVTDLSRRIDFDIHAYEGALTRGLHLAFVAVVLVETLLPPIYGNIFHQTDQNGLIFGVGGRINQIRSSLTYIEKITGMIWALTIADLIVQFLLRLYIKSKFGRYYNRGQPQ